MMKFKKISRFRGQSLVFFVIISVALLAFIAVVIDGSNIYAMRRLAQNAADAGALAGARQLCITNNTSLAQVAAEDYATTKNYARLPTTITQTAQASVGGGYVDVNVDILYSTFFARILGMDEMNAVAHAQAGCFPPGGAEGQNVIPIAYECPNLQETKGPDGKTYLFCDLDANVPPDTSCTLGDDADGIDDMIYLFFDIDPEKDALFYCKELGDPPDGAILITCDLDNDDDDEIDFYPIHPLMPNQKWYWFNPLDKSCNAAGLVGIIENGISEPLYPHVWYPGCTGAKLTVFDAIANYREGETVILPVFHPHCTQAELVVNKDPKCEIHAEDTIKDPTYIKDHFHLWSFGAFKISCSYKGGKDCSDTNIHARAAFDMLNKGIKGLPAVGVKSMEGCFINDFVSGIIGDPGGVITGAWTIYLTK